MTFKPQPQPPTSKELEKQKTLFVVADSHLDTQWRWTIQDTIRDYLPATLFGNFAHFKKYPNYILSFEGAFRYQLMEEYYPEAFEELKRWVAKGRWHPAGAMLDAPDVNLVSPESLFRHILLGNHYFEETFGIRSKDIFLPDGFGFSFALPSVAAHCGLKGFSSQKFIKWVAPAKIPFDIGLWIGPDGQGVVAALNPEGYGSGIDDNLARAERWEQRLEQLDRLSGLKVGYKYYGLGDRGGAVDEASVEWLERAIQDGPIRVVSCRSDLFYELLTDEQIERLPVHRDELLLPTHGTGCLTSQAILKRWNRKNEQLADAAERLASVAHSLGASPYPASKLKAAWTRFLWHQMHDDLTGTSIPAAYAFSWNDEVLSLNQFSQVKDHSVRGIAAQLDTTAVGQPVIVTHTLSWASQAVIKVDLKGSPFAGAPAVEVYCPTSGTLRPSQRQQIDDRDYLLFEASVPPLSATTYDLRVRSDQPEPLIDVAPLSASTSELANELLRVRLDQEGNIASIQEAATGYEYLAEPIRLAVFKDRSNKWPAWEIRHQDTLESPKAVLGPNAEIRVIESGAVRVGVEVRRRYKRSLWVERITLARGSRQIDVASYVDWQQRGSLLKLSVKTRLTSPSATFDLGYGVLERPVAERRKYEVPAQQWADLSETSSEAPGNKPRYGLSILNDCKYGWDRPDAQTLRLSLLRSPRTFRKFRHQASQDIGEHHYRYSLLAHPSDWRQAQTVRHAAEVNQPPTPYWTGSHEGPLGTSWSFLRLSTDNIVVRAVKRSEDGEHLVVRLQEAHGNHSTESRLTIADGSNVAAIVKALECDGCEQERATLPVEEGQVVLAFGPFETKTLRLELQSAPRPTSMPRVAQSVSVGLPLNWSIASLQGRATQPGLAGFGPHGTCVAAELWPLEVHFDSARFELASVPAEGELGHHVVRCEGQSIALPRQAGDVWILAAADEQQTADFVLDGRKEALRVGSWQERLGAWRSTPAKPSPAVMREEPVAWIGTHRHNAEGEDEPYVFSYLFALHLGGTPGSGTLVLPRATSVKVAAVSVVTNSPPAVTRANRESIF